MPSGDKMNDQFHGVVHVVGGHVHLIDHILDEKQPPAARRLLPGQLGRQVGRLGFGDGLLQTAVGDADPQVCLLYTSRCV